MINIKKLISTSLAVALATGMIFSSGTVNAFAAEPETEGETSFSAEIEVEAQTKDGKIHELNEGIQPGTTLEVEEDALTITMSVKGPELKFENEEGRFVNDIIKVENQEDEENTVRTYSIPVEDITEKVLTLLPVQLEEDEIEEIELFIVFLPEDEVIDRINGTAEEEAVDSVDASEEERTDDEEEKTEDAAEENEVVVEMPLFRTADAVVDADQEEEEENTSFTAKAGALAIQTAAVLADAMQAEASKTATEVPKVKATELADGEYTITIEAREMDSDSVHQRNEDLIKQAKLIVSNGSIDVYFASVGRELTFQNGSGSFENKTLSKYEPENSEIRSDGVNLSIENNYLVTLSSLSDDIIAKFPAGGSPDGALTYRIVLLENTLNVVSLVDDGSDDDNDNNNNNNSNNNSNGSGSSNTSSGTKSSGSSVKTGDETPVTAVVITLILAGGVIAFTLLRGKKKEV